MTEKILLTGGSGFIGANVVDRALARGFTVRNLDFRPPRKAEHRALWQEMDVRDRAKLVDAIVSFAPDRVLHLASDIDVNIRTLGEFQTTIGGTSNVLEAVKQLPDLKRFIHTSTQFVVRPGVEPKDERFLDPYTVYGEAKAETEKLVWAADLQVPWFILRPTIIWGPHHPSFAQQIFRHMKSRRYLHPVGRAPINRAFGYVGNVADQMFAFAMLDAGATDRHVFYLGDDSIDYDLWADAFSVGLTGKPARRIPVSLLKLMGTVGDGVKALGLRSPIDSGRAFRMSTASRIDLKPTHDVVGPPQTSFDAGVKETLAWLKSLE